MKIQNYLLGIGVALGVLLTSCEQDNEKAIYAGNTMGVTFGFNSQSVNFPSELAAMASFSNRASGYLEWA